MQSSGKVLSAGQTITLDYKGEDINAIIIDPDGLGKGLPSAGIDIWTLNELNLIPHAAFLKWINSENKEAIQLPYGNTLELNLIELPEGKKYYVSEFCDFALSNGVPIPMIEMAAVNFYSSLFTRGKGEYTRADSKTVKDWVLNRKKNLTDQASTSRSRMPLRDLASPLPRRNTLNPLPDSLASVLSAVMETP